MGVSEAREEDVCDRDAFTGERVERPVNADARTPVDVPGRVDQVAEVLVALAIDLAPRAEAGIEAAWIRRSSECASCAKAVVAVASPHEERAAPSRAPVKVVRD